MIATMQAEIKMLCDVGVPGVVVAEMPKLWGRKSLIATAAAKSGVQVPQETEDHVK
jgi:hypothetical protein